LEKATKVIILVGMLLPLLLGLTNETFTAQAASTAYLGISSYPTSTTQVQNIINMMNSNGLNIYRMSFSSAWGSSTHPYRKDYVQYFLDHSSYTIIVDRNHIYPPTEAGARDARSHWSTVRNSIFEVLRSWPNNPRVMVELINEYVSSDFYSRMQALVNEIRAAGYTNPIVINKWSQPWTLVKDPQNKVYQAYHYYFNTWSTSYAISNVKSALSKGIKLINTEIGASYNEHDSFTYSNVDKLNSFLSQCASLGVGNTVWMNWDLHNWSTYRSLGLNFPTVSKPSTSSPSPTPSPAPTPTADYEFSDGFESNSLRSWSGTTVTSGDSVRTASSEPYSGSYHARFYTSGSYSSRESAYIRKNIDLEDVTATGYFYFSGYQTSTILRDNSDRLYLIRLNSGSGEIALAGIIRENRVIKWRLWTRNGVTSTATPITAGRFYQVSLSWNAAEDVAEMWVNGQRILSASTDRYAEATRVDMGIIDTYSTQRSITLYGDSFSIYGE